MFPLQPDSSAAETASASGAGGQETKLRGSIAMGQVKHTGVRTASLNGASLATATVRQLVCGAQPHPLPSSLGQSPQQLPWSSSPELVFPLSALASLPSAPVLPLSGLWLPLSVQAIAALRACCVWQQSTNDTPTPSSIISAESAIDTSIWQLRFIPMPVLWCRDSASERQESLLLIVRVQLVLCKGSVKSRISNENLAFLSCLFSQSCRCRYLAISVGGLKAC